jgi:hypothetical protein
MKLSPIESSMLTAHGHDPATGKMQVQMRNGSVYEYDGVPLEKYAAFTGAASPGAFFNKKIKGAHTGRKISGPVEE